MSELLGRPGKGATIIDVARLAGVSPMTVSRVINAKSGVREETRAAVQDAIRELAYTPNLAARKLVTAREARIGVIYSNPSAAFMSNFLTGVFEEASQQGAQLSLLKAENGHLPERASILRLIDSGVTGVVLAPPLGEAVPLRTMLQALDIPVVIVGAAVTTGELCVRIDDRAAAYDMTRRLLDLGHRRLGFIAGNPDQTASAKRLAGFREAAGEIAGVEIQVAQGNFSYASGLTAGERLLDTERPPTAIFASNDDMAAAVVSVAHRRRLDVPRDLTVVGFDDTTAAVTLWPPLTTVRQPLRDMAATAIDLLLHGTTGGRDHVLPHMLIERESTEAPPALRAGE